MSNMKLNNFIHHSMTEFIDICWQFANNSPVPDSCCWLHLVVTAKSFGVVCQGKVLASFAKGEDAFCAATAAVTGMRAVSCQSRLQQSSRLHWQLCTKGCTVEFTELFVYDRTRHLNVVGSCLKAINWLNGKRFLWQTNLAYLAPKSKEKVFWF